MSILKLEIEDKPFSVNRAHRSAIVKGRLISRISLAYKQYKREIASKISTVYKNDTLLDLAMKMDSRAIFVRLMVYSDKTFTRKNTISKTFGDCDNFLKPIIDSTFIVLKKYNQNLDDSQVTKIEVEKIQSDREYFTLELFILD